MTAATERLSSRRFVCGVRPGPGEPRGPGETPAPGLFELLAVPPRLTDVAGPLDDEVVGARPPGVREGEAPSPAFIPMLLTLALRLAASSLEPAHAKLRPGHRDLRSSLD